MLRRSRRRPQQHFPLSGCLVEDYVVTMKPRIRSARRAHVPSSGRKVARKALASVGALPRLGARRVTADASWLPVIRKAGRIFGARNDTIAQEVVRLAHLFASFVTVVGSYRLEGSVDA